MRRWRWFVLATAGLFGHVGGSEWDVSHYRMRKASRRMLVSALAATADLQLVSLIRAI
jgi:hypothetical protein